MRLVLVASVVCCAAARADLTIVQKIDGTEGTKKVVLKVKGDKARVEVNPQITTILDAKTGELTTLLNDQKTVMHISGDKAKAMAEMAKSVVQDGAPEKAVPKPTGRKEKIGGFETEEYVSDTPKLHTAYWVAKNYPNAQNILAQMTVLQNGVFAAMRRGMPDFHDLPGLPLRTQIKMQGQGEITSTIDSLKTDPIADSEFAIPADYSEMKLPDFLGGKKTPDKPGQE